MATLGNKRKLYIVTGTGTSTYTWISGEQNNSVNLTNNAINVSDKSTEWEQFIAGTKGGTINATIFLDDTASAPQRDLFEGLVNGTTAKVFVGELGTSSVPSTGLAVDCIVTSVSDTNNSNEVASRSLTLQMTGEPTFYPTIA